MPRREQRAFVVFATWMISGLFLDGWAHRHSVPESFFTPWHGVLYTGFAAAVSWGVVDGRHQAKVRSRQGQARIPIAGERLTMFGAALFLVGGTGDMLWHSIFGIEQDLEALLSPTHLLLMAGGMLAASGPARAAWITGAEGDRSIVGFAPVAFSAALTAALAVFFTQYLNAFLLEELSMSEADQVIGVASVLVTTVVLLVPALLVHRRWAPPPGTFTLYFAVVAVLSASLEAFDRWPLAAAAIVAGAVADLCSARRLRPAAFAVAATATMWTSFFAAFAATGGLGWTEEIWTGSIVVATLLAGALGLLAQGPAGVALDAADVAVDHALHRPPEDPSPR